MFIGMTKEAGGRVLPNLDVLFDSSFNRVLLWAGGRGEVRASMEIPLACDHDVCSISRLG